MPIESKSHITDAIEFFTYQLKANGAADATIAAYRRDLILLAHALDNPQVGSLTPEHFAWVFNSTTATTILSGQPKAIATLGRMKATYRTFGAWLADVKACSENPARLLKIKRPQAAPPTIFTAEQLKALRKAIANRKGDLASRDFMMLALFAETGIRLSELAGLNIADINLTAKMIKIKAKGGTIENRFINADLRRRLLKYFKKRSGIITQSDALFLSTHRSRITSRQIERRFKSWLTWAGLPDHFTVHSLRHTFATELYRRTHDLLLVAKALGHKRISTTTIYAQLADDALEAALETS